MAQKNLSDEINIPLPVGEASRRIWRFAQIVAALVTAGLVVGLAVEPVWTLGCFWNVVVPLLPATFLISPVIWRSVCPLATANMLTNGLVSRRRLGIKTVRRTGTFGALLLLVLVPARHLVFNQNGVVLACAIGFTVGTALVAGAVFDSKAGFCNSICPVLSVERLYGQSPLLRVQNPRCASCTLCTAKACVDLTPGKSLRQVIGPDARTYGWMTRPYGVFALAFPGFVLGYFLTSDGGSIAGVYGTAVGWSAISFAVFGLVIRTGGVDSQTALPVLGAAAVGVYYWFATPGTAEFLGLGDPVVHVLRVATLVLTAWWLYGALSKSMSRSDRAVPTAPPRGP